MISINKQLLEKIIKDSNTALEIFRKINSNKYKFLSQWIREETAQYNISTIMEGIYIILNGPPIYCQLGNKPKFVNYTTGYQKFCKQSCVCFTENARIKTLEVFATRTNEEWVSINEKVTNTCIERYGHNRASATASIIKNTKETNKERYGHISFIGSEKYKDQCLDRHGVDHTTKTKTSKEAKQKTNLERYGVEHIFSSKIIRDKINQTNLEKYGSIFPTQNNELRKRISDAGRKTGRYLDPVSKSDWDIYKHDSHFVGGFDQFANSEIDIRLLNENKVYCSYTNKMGVVRDHMFSRMHGFKNGVFVEIIRHPANCQILLHKENARKKSDSSISLVELFFQIEKWNKYWHEQLIVLEKIELYQSGKRWQNQFKSII